MPALFAVVVGVLLVLVSREHYTDMEPLVGTSTAIRRQLPWWRPAVTGVLAVVVGLAALAIPLPGAFDIRRSSIRRSCSSRTRTRWRRRPGCSATLRRRRRASTWRSTSIGESPGRLRLAVLDDYEPEGWRQRAEFAVTGEVVTPSAFDDVAGAVAVAS